MNSPAGGNDMQQTLCDRARALQNIRGQSSFTAEEHKVLDHCLAAASDGIRRWCKRDFTAQLYDELYDGTGTRALMLREYPVLAVERVAHNPSTVLRVKNTSSSNQR